MLIDFQFSGGYGGLFAKQPIALSTSPDDLDQDNRSKLLALIESSGLLEIEAAPAGAPPGPQRDVFTYRLSIREGDMVKSFAFDDTTAPTSAHPLLMFLRQLAIDRQRSAT